MRSFTERPALWMCCKPRLQADVCVVTWAEAGLGLDAKAALLTAGKFRQWPGAARYVAAALWAQASFVPIDIEAEMELEGGACQRVQVRVLFATVTNTPSYGAGVKIAPGARVDDGLLDLVLVPPLAMTTILELIPRVLRTGDLRMLAIQRFRARRVSLISAVPAEFHGDGEILGLAPVEIQVLPRAIAVIAPRQNPAE
jgi:diacylglycerol kinase (ATP)